MPLFSNFHIWPKGKRTPSQTKCESDHTGLKAWDFTNQPFCFHHPLLCRTHTHTQIYALTHTHSNFDPVLIWILGWQILCKSVNTSPYTERAPLFIMGSFPLGLCGLGSPDSHPGSMTGLCPQSGPGQLKAPITIRSLPSRGWHFDESFWFGQSPEWSRSLAGRRWKPTF